nr:MAG TPA: hypothetical protein [Crassvirales sp.]
MSNERRIYLMGVLQGRYSYRYYQSKSQLN